MGEWDQKLIRLPFRDFSAFGNILHSFCASRNNILSDGRVSILYSVEGWTETDWRWVKFEANIIHISDFETQYTTHTVTIISEHSYCQPIKFLRDDANSYNLLIAESLQDLLTCLIANQQTRCGPNHLKFRARVWCVLQRGGKSAQMFLKLGGAHRSQWVNQKLSPSYIWLNRKRHTHLKTKMSRINESRGNFATELQHLPAEIKEQRRLKRWHTGLVSQRYMKPKTN